MANGLKAKLRYSEQDGKQCVVYEFKNSTPMYGCLPEAVVKWFGLPDRNPELLTRAKRGSDFCASDLNDGMGYGFKRIATAIERTYLRDEA